MPDNTEYITPAEYRAMAKESDLQAAARSFIEQRHRFHDRPGEDHAAGLGGL